MKLNGKRRWVLAILAAVIVAAVLLLTLGGDQKQMIQGNLLKNGDFLLVDDGGLPEGWYTDAWIKTVGYSEYSVEDGTARIVNNDLNDARFAQDVAVQPDSLYCFSGFIRADASSGWGANLSIADVSVFSKNVYDSEGEWVLVSLYGRTGEDQHEVTVFARLGGYSGEAVGEAAFRDLRLEQVESVPSNYVAYPWYQAPDTRVDDGESGSAAWWLCLAALIYALVCALLCRSAMQVNPPEIKKRGWPGVIMMLAAALVARIAVALMIPGYGTDVGCFTAWANMMADVGPARFYQEISFCDYPPGYLMVLWLFGGIGKLLGTGATEFLIKLPSILCDLVAAAVLYGFARKHVSPKAAFALSALYAFNPVTFAAGAAWGQSDSVMALCILLVVVLACESRWSAALPVYMLSVLMKPQALMFGPLGLAALLYVLIRNRGEKAQLRSALIGVGLAVVVALVVLAPFSIHQESPLWVIELYAGTMGYYSNVTVNACNLFFLFGKNWIGVENASPWWLRLLALMLLFSGMIVAAFKNGWFKNEKRTLWHIALLSGAALSTIVFTALPLTYAAFGTVMIVLCVLLCMALYLKRGALKHLPLAGATLLILLCNLGTMMHERYLYPAIILLALACVCERDKRVYWLFAALTATTFLNVGLVLDRGVRIGGSAGHLDAPAFGIVSDSAWIEYIISVLNCLLTVFAGSIAFSLCWDEQLQVMRHQEEARQEKVEKSADTFLSRAEKEFKQPQPIQKMNKLDWILMLVTTAVYAVVAFTNLGATTSPQTWWRSKTADETVVLDLGQERTFNMLYLGGIQNSDNDFVVRTSDDGVYWSEANWAKLSEGDCFKWQYVCQVSVYDGGTSYTSQPLKMTGRYVQIQAQKIATALYEVILRDPDTQEVFPVSVVSGDGENLIDEQTAFSGEPGWYNSTYFDEIYHARTGYEHYQAMHGDYSYKTYETSHPPLGKVLIAFGISIFGMTPFGWRFAGTLMGVLMLPGMYMLGKLLTKRRLLAFAAMFLMAVDCMHFTQTRIATIDSYAVLFIIWQMVFMIYYIRMDYWRTKFWKTLVPLALSGLFMGLGVASKWTGCYSGVGLALLFFWSVFRRLQEIRYAKGEMEKSSKKSEIPEHLRVAAETGIRRLIITVLWCVLFFVIVPCVIYYVSYIPYFLAEGGVTLKKIIHAAETMLWYHSEPGRGMDHPFYSPWYEWPVIAKPMWYYSSSYHADGVSQTIAAMGNPAVWWTGLAALAAVACVWCLRHVGRDGLRVTDSRNDMRPATLLIAFAAQYLPWTLVPRGVYIYHYFSSVPFIILCITLCFDLLCDALKEPIEIRAWQYRALAAWNHWFNHAVSDRLAEKAQITYTLRLKAVPVIVLFVYLAVALALFIAFFPYASGITAKVGWLSAMQWFPRWLWY